jgi:hypothetical protein
MLEVDPLGKAIGRDEDGLIGFTKEGDSLFAFIRRVFTGDRLDGSPLDGSSEVLCHVTGGGDVAAEDDRSETLVEQLANMPR